MADNLDPIVIPSDSIGPFISTLLQRGLLTLLGYLGMSGYFSDSDVAKVASGFIALGLTLWGAYRSYKSNEQKKLLQNYAPNKVAVTSDKVK